MAAADLHVEQEELRFLQMLRDALDLDPLTIAAIERGARARYPRFLEEAHREIAEIELRIDALLVDRLEGGVDRVLEVGRALGEGDGVALAEEARLQIGAAGEDAAVVRAGCSASQKPSCSPSPKCASAAPDLTASRAASAVG